MNVSECLVSVKEEMDEQRGSAYYGKKSAHVINLL